MGTLKFANRARSTLAASIESGDTECQVQSADAAKFPSLAAGDWFMARLRDASANMEIVKVTARASGVLTIVRAQEGTTARAFDAGSPIDLAITAGSLVDMQKGNGNPDVPALLANLGLDELDNTADVDKPVSTAQQTAIDDAINAAISTLKAGLGKRQTVRFRTTANVDLSGGGLAAGTSHDGVTAVTGDLVLVAAQSAAAQNGIYVVPASGAASRHEYFDTYAEHAGALISVQEGTAYADTLWLCTSNTAGTLGTTAIAFSNVSIVVAASESVAGVVQLSSAAEAITGSSTTKAVHPAGLKAAVETGYRWAGRTILTADGTYSWPAGTRLLRIRAVAPGGGGGSAKSTDSDSAAGAGSGGAGEYFEGHVTVAALVLAGFASSFAVTVPAGAAGGTNGNDGNDGSNLLIGVAGALLILKGGKGGKGRSTGAYLGAEGGDGGADGTISSPLVGMLFPGQSGGFGEGSDQDSGNYCQVGPGGSSPFGGAARGRHARGTFTSAGLDAKGKGAGGGGALSASDNSNAAGGAGSGGLIIIDEYI